MNADDDHTLGTLRVELNFSADEWAKPWMDGVFALWREHLAADTDKIFKAVSPAGQVWSCETMELDLGVIGPSRFFEEFREKFGAALRAELEVRLHFKPKLDTAGVASTPATIDDHELSTLTYALLHGTAPWAARDSWDVEESLDRLLDRAPSGTLRTLRSLGREEQVRRRLARWLDDPHLARLIRALVPTEADFIVHYAETLQERHRESTLAPERTEPFRDAVWELILAHALGGRGSQFNEKAFLRDQIAGLAARFRRSFTELLEDLARVLRDGLAQGSTARDGSLRTLIEELANEERGNRLMGLLDLDSEENSLPAATSSELPAYLRVSEAEDLEVLKHGLEHGSWPNTTRGKHLAGVHRLIPWIQAMIVSTPADTLRTHLIAWAKEGRMIRALPSYFDEELLGAILIAAAPEGAAPSLAWIERALLHHEQSSIAHGVSTANVRAALWEELLGAFLLEERSALAYREFVEEMSQRLARRFSLSAASVADFLGAALEKPSELAILKQVLETGLWPPGTKVGEVSFSRLPPSWIQTVLTSRRDSIHPHLTAWAREGKIIRGLTTFFDDSVISAVVMCVSPDQGSDALIVTKRVLDHAVHLPIETGVSTRAFRSALWEAVLEFFLTRPGSQARVGLFWRHLGQRLAQRFALEFMTVIHFLHRACAEIPASPLVVALATLAEEAARTPVNEESAEFPELMETASTADPPSTEAKERLDETRSMPLTPLQAFWRVLTDEEASFPAESVQGFSSVWANGAELDPAAYRALVERARLTPHRLERVRSILGANGCAAIFFGRDRKASERWANWIQADGSQIPGGVNAWCDALWKGHSFSPDAVAYVLRTGGEPWLSAAIFADHPGAAREWLSWLIWLRRSALAPQIEADRPTFAVRLWQALVDLRSLSRGRLELGLGIAAVLARCLQRLGVRLVPSSQAGSLGRTEAHRVWRDILLPLKAALSSENSTLSRVLARSVERSLEASGTSVPYVSGLERQDRPEPAQRPSETRDAAIAEKSEDIPKSHHSLLVNENKKPATLSLPASTQEEAEPLFVSNAGLVLLAPFFSVLFARTGLTDRNGFRGLEAAHRAVHLTQYLLSEGKRTRDYHLALNKVLCGLDPAEPLVSTVDLTPEERAVSGELLSTALARWNGLGQVSVDGFKNSFLWRAGRLMRKEDRWELVVERRGWDVLLQSLPWSFALLKSSWMPLPLHTTW